MLERCCGGLTCSSVHGLACSSKTNASSPGVIRGLRKGKNTLWESCTGGMALVTLRTTLWLVECSFSIGITVVTPTRLRGGFVNLTCLRECEFVTMSRVNASSPGVIRGLRKGKKAMWGSCSGCEGGIRTDSSLVLSGSSAETALVREEMVVVVVDGRERGVPAVTGLRAICSCTSEDEITCRTAVAGRIRGGSGR